MIRVRGAAEHNLKDVDVDLPSGRLVVVTGVSGSGKSSLAFDTICAEGRHRYLDTFPSYARQFLATLPRPSLGHIDGLSPAVSVDQSASVSNPRSTVGTLTEIYDLMRLLWARDGSCPGGRETAVRLSRALFSFNSPHGACPACKGLGVEDRLDPDLLVKDGTKSIREGALRITTPTGYLIYSQVTLDVLEQVCRAHGFSVDVAWNDLTIAERDVVLNGSDRIRIPYGKHPLASRLRWSGITAKPREEGVYKGILPVMEQILRAKRNRNILRFVRSLPCRACEGSRLRPEALAVRWQGLTIAQAAARTIDDLQTLFEPHSHHAPGANAANSDGAVSEAVATQIVSRCRVLQQLGLGYLALDRESTTLSAGESQRIRLARLASVGLSGLMYVLDEPSVGLHHRDTGHLLEVLRTLAARGNTVLVVEHDEQVMRQADWIVDVGPAAGDYGGRVLFNGPGRIFASDDDEAAGAVNASVADSRTRAFLTGREKIALPASRRPGTGTIRVADITRHNLDRVSVEFRLGAFNVVTGVSGAGKSTLVQEALRWLRDEKLQPGGASRGRPGSPTAVQRIIEIDQAPVGRTPRSNPATYTGLFDAVRDLFAAEPAPQSRGFGKGRFSFNVKGGRCEACEGAGVQQVGMQFLGVVSVVCDVCGGRRFNDETLEVRYRGKDIHEVLEMPIEEAAVFFGGVPAIARPLEAMRTLGLGYLALGHPATMLSGGEGQRVKLATELARPGTGRTLYVLDEPTTGLHSADVALLLTALDRLVAGGNTVIAIEHHLDVIKTADWVVDMGPGSGPDGGRVVAAGTPEAIAEAVGSATGEALRSLLSPAPCPERAVPLAGASRRALAPPAPLAPLAPPAPLRFTNVTTHNLQHIDVEIPAGCLTVITGVSGSGKSSLAFDTLFAEARQRYAQTFSPWARRFVQRASEAEFDSAEGLTPAIAISQQRPSGNPRSNVATLTGIHDCYRLLFSRAGTRYCPRCEMHETADGSNSATAPWARLEHGVCPRCGHAGARALTASMFSPNSQQGACPRCKGLGHILDCDPEKLITDPSRALANSAMAGHRTGRFYGDPHGQHMAMLAAVGRALDIDFAKPWNELDERARQIALHGAGDRSFEVEWRYVRGARSGVHRFSGAWPGLATYVRQEYERKHGDRRGEALAPLMRPVPCEECVGGKLKAEFLAVRFAGLSIDTLVKMTVADSLEFFEALDNIASARPPSTRQALDWPGPSALAITADLRREVIARLRNLHDAALGYLSLDRPVATLSGGESQRVRLATQLDSGLSGITYVLDEPTAGLHSRDTARLLGLIGGLTAAGNTVVVVEHDEDVIAAADHVIELGPAAGERGGRVVKVGKGQGDPKERRLVRASAARSLQPGIAIRGARAHNLRSLDVDIPFGGLVAVTGVSGSGKSSLVFDVLAPSVERHLNGERAVNCSGIVVQSPVAGVVRVDRPAPVTSVAINTATQCGLFDPFRRWFAATDAARAHGLGAAQFGTTVPGGRCEECEGTGQIRVSMDFLPDIWTECEQCQGKRYGREALACTIDGHSIADLLHMTARSCLDWIAERDGHLTGAREVARRLEVLCEIGLDYLALGQPHRTLSGGERQRLTLATALIAGGARGAKGAREMPCLREGRSGGLLYTMDEPTLGLHSRDVQQLLRVFDRLVAAGHTIVVVEHHLAVIGHADWVIDLGPEGGPGGGRVVAIGPPAAVARVDASHTGRALRDVGFRL